MPAYGKCPRKHQARDLTVVQAYRNLTGLRSIPKDQQYWTLCGPLADSTGGLQPGCELIHVLEAGLLLRPSQFHGVERLEEVHLASLAAVRGAFRGKQPNLYHGEFHTVLEQALSRKALKPAIVNLDTLYEPTSAAVLLGQVLHLLNYVPGPKMVILNVIVDNPRYGRRHSMQRLVEAVRSDAFCHHQLGFGWVESDQGLIYAGTGKTSVKMGTTIFYQPYREAACRVTSD